MDTEDAEDANDTTITIAETSEKAIHESPHNESYEGTPLYNLTFLAKDIPLVISCLLNIKPPHN